MIRLLLALCMMIWLTAPVSAQDPIVDLELSAESTVVGQPLILRLTVLVPSFMPQPPALPSFETPNLMVRLGERATSPTSRTVDGESWSGITRSYRLLPMVAGPFTLPSQEVTITFMGSAGAEQTSRVTTELVSFEATLPEGAQDLDPPLIATNLTATQEITAPEGPLRVGDALGRSVEIKIEGTSPLFIPPLLGADIGAELRAYPKEPVLSESENRGVLSGTRREETSYVTLAEGTATLPALTLSWYNLKSNTVETLELEGASFEVAAGPEAPVEWDRGMILRLGLGALALMGLAYVAVRFLRPGVVARIEAWRVRRRQSAAAMHRAVTAAVAARDLPATVTVLDAYVARHGASPTNAKSIENALAGVMETRFGVTETSRTETDTRWRALADALETLRPERKPHRDVAILPELNPG